MRYAFLTPILAILAGPALASEAHAASDIAGFWMNPKHTLAVHTDTCGTDLCGRVAWASTKAEADGRDSGVPHLLGIELLENYRFRGKGVWQGTVFVPDMGRHFASEIDELSPNRLKVSGCILGGLLCKSQVWTRIQSPPSGQVPA